jgi:hypothetical protein
MAQIIIEYDARNKTALNLLKILKEIGLFKFKEFNGLDQAILEKRTGKTTKCKDFNDYLKKVK